MAFARGVALAFLTAFIWGTIPLAGKLALMGFGTSGFEAALITFTRFVLALACLALFLRFWRGKLVMPMKATPWFLAAAAGLLGNYLLYMWGLAFTTAAAAQIIIQLASVFFFAWAALFLGERATPRRLGGIALAIVGVILVVWNGRPVDVVLRSEDSFGNLLIVASGLSWSLYGVAQKKLNESSASYDALLLVFLLAGLMVLPLALPASPVEALGGLGWLAALAIVYLGVNTFTAYAAFAEALQHADAQIVTTITTLAPVVTIALLAASRVLLPGAWPDEPLTVWTLLGAVLVVSGIALAILTRGVFRVRRALPPG